MAHRPRQPRPRQLCPGQFRPGQPRPRQPRSRQFCPRQFRPRQPRPRQPRPGQPRPGQPRLRQPRPLHKIIKRQAIACLFYDFHIAVCRKFCRKFREKDVTARRPSAKSRSLFQLRLQQFQRYCCHLRSDTLPEPIFRFRFLRLHFYKRSRNKRWHHRHKHIPFFGIVRKQIKFINKNRDTIVKFP